MDKFKLTRAGLPRLQNIIMLGNYPPRQCGIATFTADLSETLASLNTSMTIDSIAMSDRDGYIYPERVELEIPEKDAASYGVAAALINQREYDVLSVQHEYGIFGGQSGEMLLELVRKVKVPVVTTLHTVLKNPSESQKRVMDMLLQLSERVVVMSKKAVEFLEQVHGVSPDKIDLIPHGIPDISSVDGKTVRDRLNIKGPMILTFGLLSPDKGIQYVIEAMPAIVREHPGATYVIVGATHPHVRTNDGEVYRESLEKLARDLGVSANVRFVDRFVSTVELVEYLAAMDIYVTPYLNQHQITSGTLAYAIGAGKAVISTPYWYAEELLDEGRGLLVPFRNAEAIAEAILHIQNDPKAREEMGERAAEFGRQMLWAEVGNRYLETFERAKKDRAKRHRIVVQDLPAPTPVFDLLPTLKLNHLFEMSDDTGILQHATFTIPNRYEGYCVDDNARALLLTVMLEENGPLSPEVSLLQSRYLSFVLDAYNPENGRFRNFMGFQRDWLETIGSEDSHGRTMWALGNVVTHCRDNSRRELAKCIFEWSAPAVLKTTSPRTWAYALLGADEYLRDFPLENSIQSLRQTLANRLMRIYDYNKSEDWPWFEQSLSYANARISQSLILSGDALGNPLMLEAGLESLAWLMEQQTGPNGVFAPIGSDGFYSRGAPRSYFDQQPVEAWGSISACLTAAKITGEASWKDEAHRAFRWFLGENMIGLPVYDKSTGGCHDGLHEYRVNRNQGAESTLSFLCSVTELRHAIEKPEFAITMDSSNHKISYEIKTL